MIIVAFVLSLVFGSLGFIVTRNNARFLLAGYNTMSEQDRELFDIDSYLTFFKKFHLILAASLLGGVLLLNLKSSNWASMFMTVYPLSAYLFFIIRTANRYPSPGQSKRSAYLVGGILLVVISTLVIQGFGDYKSSELVLSGEKLEITGSYGFTLRRDQVNACELVDKLPEIAYKSNGFAAGDYAKGSFKTKDGKSVYLFVNKEVKPIIRINSQKGDIYYNHDELNIPALQRQVESWQLQKQ